jgi:hypothetical protein
MCPRECYLERQLDAISGIEPDEEECQTEE